MKKLFIILITLLLILSGALIFWVIQKNKDFSFLSPLGSIKKEKEKPLEKYAFEKLFRREYQGSEIKLEKMLKGEQSFKSYLFSYQSDGKKITGVAKIPTQKTLKEEFPVVVLIRGYVDKEMYYSGLGTDAAASFFAKNGFITLAPDFLGFGESDERPQDDWEDRFHRPIDVMNLLDSIETLEESNPEKVCLWAHSNGGQIALSVLEISQKPIPTTLWAPVSKFFPYSVLYYTDLLEDEGKYLRRILADFEKDYDVDRYSSDKFLDRIQAPIIIHQGTADEYVPVKWTEQLVDKLKDLKKETTYYTYPGADHNLKPSWETVVSRDLNFFQANL